LVKEREKRGKTIHRSFSETGRRGEQRKDRGERGYAGGRLPKGGGRGWRGEEGISSYRGKGKIQVFWGGGKLIREKCGGELGDTLHKEGRGLPVSLLAGSPHGSQTKKKEGT